MTSFWGVEAARSVLEKARLQNGNLNALCGYAVFLLRARDVLLLRKARQSNTETESVEREPRSCSWLSDKSSTDSCLMQSGTCRSGGLEVEVSRRTIECIPVFIMQSILETSFSSGKIVQSLCRSAINLAVSGGPQDVMCTNTASVCVFLLCA